MLTTAPMISAEVMIPASPVSVVAAMAMASTATPASSWAALIGANLIHDVGYVESGFTNSSEMIVLCDDAIGMARRLLRGIEITPETLGLDTIDRIGPGGTFLTDPHTMENYRSVWYPSTFDRRNQESWQKAGGLDARERARERARELIMNHEPEPIEDAILAELDEIIATADARIAAHD